MTRKSRDIDVDKSLCGKTWFTLFGGPPQNVQSVFCNFRGSEFMADTGPHRYPGGNDGFAMVRGTIKNRPARVYAFSNTGGVDYFYSGKLFARQYANTNPTIPVVEQPSTMLAYGIKGWNRFKPTSRKGSLAQAVVELKDIPDMLKQSLLTRELKGRGRDLLTTAGSHYLNVQFGWVPFLNDVRQLIRNAQLMQKRIDQLSRDNGKWVRRSGTVDSVESTQSTLYPPSFYSSPGLGVLLGPGQETMYRTLSDRSRYWFSAKFKYYIAPAVGRLEKFLQAEHVNRILYGTDLNPALIWELVPWSWLVDWFSSTGDSLANTFQDPGDNLVAEYAYIMHSRIISDLYQVYGMTLNGQSYNCEQEYLQECKMRSAATPYGFYATPPSLTAKQTSILVALGLTHRAIGR